MQTYDNGSIKVWLGKFGWNWTRVNADGSKCGGVGFGSVCVV
jgi:hypothetical protein